MLHNTLWENLIQAFSNGIPHIPVLIIHHTKEHHKLNQNNKKLFSYSEIIIH